MAIDYYKTLLSSGEDEENEKVSKLNEKVNTLYGIREIEAVKPITEINKKYESPYKLSGAVAGAELTDIGSLQDYTSRTPEVSNISPENFSYPLTDLFSDLTNRQRERSSLSLSDMLSRNRSRVTSSTANSGSVDFNANADENALGKMDIVSELPKLTAEQIKAVISSHFSKSTVVSPSDANGIYNAQQKTGMSALAILGIGALESGYGTSTIAKKKGNLWGWGATNSDPLGNAKTFSQISTGAAEFANAYMKTYYNKYGAKSIYSAGTGNNPAGKGYAYFDNTRINPQWATDVSSIMKKFYQTAKKIATNTSGASANNTKNTSSTLAGKVGTKIADTSGYKNSGAIGQCVWYARGRMKQKFGKETGSLGNGNQMWYNAKESAKLLPKAENIKPDVMASYKTGLSAAGKKAGHVIYIEDVVGDTVYYTEGGSYYYKNGTCGVLKTASKSEILNGSSKFGYGLIGFIDAANY